jgi:hypothetical protein
LRIKNFDKMVANKRTRPGDSIACRWTMTAKREVPHEKIILVIISGNNISGILFGKTNPHSSNQHCTSSHRDAYAKPYTYQFLDADDVGPAGD